YFDKGSMAVVGKGFAVLQSGRVGLSGFVAWLAWVVVHLQFLATSSLRLSVFLQWVWTYVSGQRGDRLIISQHGSEVTKPGLDTLNRERSRSQAWISYSESARLQGR